MAEYTPEEVEKAKQKFREIAEKGRTQGDIRRSYYDIPDNKPKGGSGGMGVMPKSGVKRTPEFKNGGSVSNAAHKKALKKAGFYDEGKTKSEREKIVSKVTTKPQRLGMVEKLFNKDGPKMKQVKKFNDGGDVYDNYEKRSRINETIRKEGLAPYEIKELEMKKPKEQRGRSSFNPKGPSDAFNSDKAAKALAEYRARMGSDAGGKTISSGGGGAGIPKVGPKRPLDMKAGGKVSSASKRADGCAIKGKTRA
jgi:hypothetical protein